MPACLTYNRKFCKNNARKGRKLCWACEARKYRELRPIEWSYKQLKRSAVLRHIKFAISKAYWKVWCLETSYHLLKGLYGDDMTVDRKVPALGYVEGNIQMLTRAKNSAKRHTDVKEKYKYQRAEIDPDVPF